MAAMLISAQAVDYDGAVLSGAKLNVYDAGTTTPRAIYASKELASGASSANPAVATATGGIAVWVDDSAGDIKITLTNSAGTTTYYSQDNIDPTNGNVVVFPLGGQDQTLSTTDSVTFASLTLGAVSFAGVVADPGSDRLMFWDDSDTQVEWLSLGTGLSITANTLSLDGDLEDISGLTPADGAVIIGDGTDFTTESGATLRTSLGLAIGSDVLAYDANLQAFASAFTAPTVDGAAGQYLKTDGAGTLSFATPAGGGDTLAAANESITGYWDFPGIQLDAQSAEPSTSGAGSVAYSDGTNSTNGFGTYSGLQVSDGTQWAPVTHADPVEKYGPGAGRGTVALDQVAFAAAAAAGAMVSLRPGRTYYMHTGLTPADGFGIEFGPGSKIVAVTQASGSGSDGFKNYSGLSANRNAVAGTMFMLTNAGASHTFVNPYFEGDNSNQPILRPIFAQGNTLNILGKMTVRNMNACSGGVSLNEMLGGFIGALDVRGNADMVDSAYTGLTNYSPNGLLFDDVGTLRSSGMDFGPIVVMDLNRDAGGSDPSESDGVTIGGIDKAVVSGGRDGHYFASIYASNVGEALDCFQSNNYFGSVIARNLLGYGVKFVHGAQNNTVGHVDIDGFVLAGLLFAGSSTSTQHCLNNRVLGGRIANGGSSGDTGCVHVQESAGSAASVPIGNIVSNVDFYAVATQEYIVRSNLGATPAGAVGAMGSVRIDNCPNFGSAPVTSYSLDAQSTLIIDAASEFNEPLKRASATVRGQVELATNAEVATGTDTARAVTPAGAAAQYAPLDSPAFTSGYTLTDAATALAMTERVTQTYASDSAGDKVISTKSHALPNSAESVVTYIQEIVRAAGRTSGSHQGKKTYRVSGGGSTRDIELRYDGVRIASGQSLQVGSVSVVGAQVVNANIADPAAQTSSSITDSSGGTADGTLAAISGSGADSDINNNFADLAAKLNQAIADITELRAKLVAANTIIRTHGLGATS